jgi:hypothetical protein
LLFIKHGFTTAASDHPTYGGKPVRVGEILSICRPPEDATMSHTFSGFFGVNGVKSHLHIGGELLAMNSGDYEQGFAVCTKCGYTRSEVISRKAGESTGREGLPKGFDWHPPIHESNPRFPCWKQSEAFVLRHLHLAARQVCDYLEIELPGVSGSADTKKRIANTICQALRLSGANILNIDARELSLLKATSGTPIKISISDTLAGGAGHVRDLSAIDKTWWRDASALISDGSPREATLNLLTADAPVKDGLPHFCIESTLTYFQTLTGGLTSQHEEPDEEFDFAAASKHFKRKR